MPSVQLSDIMSDVQDTFGSRVKALRQVLGSVTKPLSFADLARLLSRETARTPPFSASTIQRWERDEGSPDPMTLLAMARLAKLTADEFIEGAWMPAPPTEPLEDADAPERAARDKRKGA